jgi:hypothetical protein
MAGLDPAISVDGARILQQSMRASGSNFAIDIRALI